MSCSSSMIRILFSDIGSLIVTPKLALRPIVREQARVPPAQSSRVDVERALGGLEPLLQVPKARLEAAAHEEPEERALHPREPAPPDVGAGPIYEEHVGPP